MMYCLTEEEYRELKNPKEITQEINRRMLAMVKEIGLVVEAHSFSWTPQFKRDFMDACRGKLTPPASTAPSPEASSTSLSSHQASVGPAE